MAPISRRHGLIVAEVVEKAAPFLQLVPIAIEHPDKLEVSVSIAAVAGFVGLVRYINDANQNLADAKARGEGEVRAGEKCGRLLLDMSDMAAIAFSETESTGRHVRRLLEPILNTPGGAVTTLDLAYLHFLAASTEQELGAKTAAAQGIDGYRRCQEAALQSEHVPLHALGLVGEAALFRKQDDYDQAWALLEAARGARAESLVARLALVAEELKLSMLTGRKVRLTRLVNVAGKLLHRGNSDPSVLPFEVRLFKGQLREAMVRAKMFLGVGSLIEYQVHLELATTETAGYGAWQGIIPLTSARVSLRAGDRAAATKLVFQQNRYAREQGLHLHARQGHRLLNEVIDGGLPDVIGGLACDCARGSRRVGAHMYTCPSCGVNADLRAA